MSYWNLQFDERALPNFSPEKYGLKELLRIEGENGQVEVIAEGAEKLRGLPRAVKAAPANREIDWEAQWESFSPHYSEGVFDFDLSPYGIPHTLTMEPGPGFGDLSHPTTRLMLEMMGNSKHLLLGANVLDLGSGSGVLSLAAKLLGAKEVVGVDIDSEANRHARKCARANQILDVRFVKPRKNLFHSRGRRVLLLNMISGEQKEAIKPFLEEIKGAKLFVSGILEKEKSSYIRWMQELGFKMEAHLQQEGWLGLMLSSRSPSRKDSSLPACSSKSRSHKSLSR